MLSIYCIDIKNEIKKVALPKEVVKHINQYKNKDYRRTSKLAWSYLAYLLKTNFKIDLKKEGVLFNRYNKPCLKHGKIYFNLSHSLNLIAIAISDNLVGVDIEKLVPDKICNLIAKRILNKNELKEFSKRKNKSDYLTKKWTQKEAYVKMVGSTILNLNKLSLIKTNDIKTKEVKDCLNNKYYLSFVISK